MSITIAQRASTAKLDPLINIHTLQTQRVITVHVLPATIAQQVQHRLLLVLQEHSRTKFKQLVQAIVCHVLLVSCVLQQD